MIGVITPFVALALTAQHSTYLGPSVPLEAGTAAIHGRVLDAASNGPVANLEVLLFDTDNRGRPGTLPRSGVVRTDAAGRFSFSRIGAGDYRIRVTGKTHLPACVGSAREGEEPCQRITIKDGQVRSDVVIVTRPAAIIRGRLGDHLNRPVRGAEVSAMCVGAERCLERAMTDANGRFEIGGIPPGDATLSAEFAAGDGSEVAAFYPGVWEIDEALPVAATTGQPANIEFRLPKAVMGSITARVVGPAGYRLERFQLSQSDRTMQALDGPVARIDHLREGRYLLHALAAANNKRYAGFKSVDVSDGNIDATVSLEEAGVITGRIVSAQGGAPPLDGQSISAWWVLDEDVVGAELVDVSADGSFVFNGIFGDRVFRVRLANGWSVASVRANGKDVTDDVVRVTPGSRTQVVITVGRQ